MTVFERTSRQRVGNSTFPFLKMMSLVAPCNIGGRHGVRRGLIERAGLLGRAFEQITRFRHFNYLSLEVDTLLVEAWLSAQIPLTP
jgi:hypothetical protein